MVGNSQEPSVPGHLVAFPRDPRPPGPSNPNHFSGGEGAVERSSPWKREKSTLPCVVDWIYGASSAAQLLVCMFSWLFLPGEDRPAQIGGVFLSLRRSSFRSRICQAMRLHVLFLHNAGDGGYSGHLRHSISASCVFVVLPLSNQRTAVPVPRTRTNDRKET